MATPPTVPLSTTDGSSALQSDPTACATQDGSSIRSRSQCYRSTAPRIRASCLRSRGGLDATSLAPYRWRLLDGVGHFPHEEAPERFDREVLSWLQDPEPDR